jgi:hypothetical protein
MLCRDVTRSLQPPADKSFSLASTICAIPGPLVTTNTLSGAQLLKLDSFKRPNWSQPAVKLLAGWNRFAYAPKLQGFGTGQDLGGSALQLAARWKRMIQGTFGTRVVFYTKPTSGTPSSFPMAAKRPRRQSGGHIRRWGFPAERVQAVFRWCHSWGAAERVLNDKSADNRLSMSLNGCDHFVRFRIRSFAFGGSLSLSRENSGPHTGMSFEPTMISSRKLRQLGGPSHQDRLGGPSLCRTRPWQPYISWPDAADF